MAFEHPTEAFQLRRIQFVPAQRPDVTPVPTGVDIIVLNGTLPEAQDASMKPGPSAASRNTKELFREQDVSLRWKTVQKTGAGLQNLGNTCFMNSVLQCLTHTPPLAEALLASKQLGSNNNFDPLRLTQQQVINSLQNKHKNESVAPTAHAKTFDGSIDCSFRLGRQEDAHEYLVALLDAMHESYISMCRPKPSPELSKTSMIYQIFAGRIRSQVKCTECGHESNTFDVFLDLSLEINKASSLLKALQRFTSSEYLDGANKYICPKQKQKVRAAKCMTIDKAPAVLVVQLKRFEFSMFGHKINKKVDFDTELDLGPFMSNRRGPPQPYSLYGVLVHSGHSVHSGHYYAFVKAPNGLWHQLDDNHVSQVSERVVLAQKAYILFYIKTPPTNGHTAPAEPQSPRAAHHQPAQPPAAAQKPQQAPQPNGLNKLHPAPLKSQADGKTSKASDVVYGPAERPKTGLTAALQLRDELLAPLVDASVHQQQQHSGRQSNAAFADGTAAQTAEQGTAQHQRIAAQRPAHSSMQQASAAGMPNDAGHAPSQQAASHMAEDKRQAKQVAKQKAAELGGIKRPSVLQRMNPSGLEAGPDAADMPKRKKQATDKAAAANKLSLEDSVRCAARGDAPGSASESSQQQVGSAAVATHDHAEDCVPSTSGRSDHVQPAPAFDKAARRSGDKGLQGGAGFASPASAHESPVLHGSTPAVRSPMRRPARNVLFPSPQNSWQGRSWNRLSLHHQIHRSRQLSSAVMLPHARRSISASPDRAPTNSPAKVLAAARLATEAQQPLPQDQHSSLATAVAADPRHTDAAVPDAGAAVAKPRVKRKLLTTASAIPDKVQHIQAVQKRHLIGSDQQLPKLLAQQKKGSVPH
ncbi:MAG: ubiquitin carboxyl-terminal hydrolase 23-like, partial [Trebouxia sp. A1-2]